MCPLLSLGPLLILSQKPGITVLANFSALLWFLAIMLTEHLSSLWHPTPLKCAGPLRYVGCPLVEDCRAGSGWLDWLPDDHIPLSVDPIRTLRVQGHFPCQIHKRESPGHLGNPPQLVDHRPLNSLTTAPHRLSENLHHWPTPGGGDDDFSFHFSA